MTPLVHLVADYGPGDLAYAQAVQRVALFAPEASCARPSSRPATRWRPA